MTTLTPILFFSLMIAGIWFLFRHLKKTKERHAAYHTEGDGFSSSVTIKNLEHQLRKDPSSVQATVQLARAYMRADKQTRAYELYQSIEENPAFFQNPQNVPALLEFASMALTLDKMDLTKKLIRAVQLVDEKNEKMLLLLGIFSFKEKKYKEACSILLPLIQHKDHKDAALYYLGLANYARNNYTKTLEYLKPFLGVKKEHEMLFAIADSSYRLSYKNLVYERLLSPLLKNHKWRLQSYLLLGKSYILREEPEKAHEMFEEAILPKGGELESLGEVQAIEQIQDIEQAQDIEQDENREEIDAGFELRYLLAKSYLSKNYVNEALQFFTHSEEKARSYFDDIDRYIQKCQTILANEKFVQFLKGSKDEALEIAQDFVKGRNSFANVSFSDIFNDEQGLGFIAEITMQSIHKRELFYFARTHQPPSSILFEQLLAQLEGNRVTQAIVTLLIDVDDELRKKYERNPIVFLELATFLEGLQEEVSEEVPQEVSAEVSDNTSDTPESPE